jgi:hypothetical protein
MFLIILARINQFIWIVPILFGIMKYRRLSFNAKTLYWGLIGTLCFEIYASILAHKHLSNLLVYSMLDYFLSILFAISLYKNRYSYTALFYSIIVIWFFIYFHCLSDKAATIGGYDMLLMYVINAIICAVRIRMLSSMVSTDIFSESDFWILSGLLIYFFSTSSLFYLHKYSTGINSLHLVYHTIFLFLCLIIVAALFTRAMLCKPRVKTY